MIGVPKTLKALIRGNPMYKFGGNHGPIDRSKITLRQ